MNEPTFICTRCHGEAPMSELSELPPFFFAAAGSIDACRFDAAVSENVRKPHNVLELGVVRPGEQVAQVVGKDLLRRYPRRLRQLFEHLPDVAAVKWLARPGDEHAAADDAALRAVGGELLCQRYGNENRPQLALVLDGRLSALQALHGDCLQFTDPQTEGAERLHQQGKAGIAALFGSACHALILLVGQLLVGWQKGLALDAQIFEPPVQAEEGEKQVDRAEDGIDACGAIAALREVGAEPHQRRLVGDAVGSVVHEQPQVVGVLGDRSVAVLLFGEGIGKAPCFGVGDNEHDCFSFSVKWVKGNYITLVFREFM